MTVRIVGVRKGSISLTGKEYTQHPNTTRLTQRRDGQKRVFPLHKMAIAKKFCPQAKEQQIRALECLFLSSLSKVRGFLWRR